MLFKNLVPANKKHKGNEKAFNISNKYIDKNYPKIVCQEQLSQTSYILINDYFHKELRILTQS